jgi:hypothetical protein
MVGWLVLGAAAFAAVAAGVGTPALPLRWHNDGLPARRKNFINLLGLTRSNIVLVTGRLHHGLYGDRAVLRALKTLPEVDILVLQEAERLDPVSHEFEAELRRRKAKFDVIPSGVIAHGAVFDGEHGKIEAFGVEDAAVEKAVEYFAYDPRRAQQYLNDIERAKSPISNAPRAA